MISSIRVKVYLSSVLLLLSMLPLITSYVLVDKILADVISLSLHSDVVSVMREYGEDLKSLAVLAPENEMSYIEKFQRVSELILVYRDSEQLVGILKQGYATYFFVVLIVIIGFSFVMSFWLSKRVSNSYEAVVEDLLAKERRIKQLAHLEQWQHVSATLAHEIKNPLTPIEMMVSNLSRVYSSESGAKYLIALENTQRIVDEEIRKLKNMVSHFSSFAELPSPEMKILDLNEWVARFSEDAGIMWPEIEFRYVPDIKGASVFAEMDAVLIGQCMNNIIGNAREANLSNKNLAVTFSLKAHGDEAIVGIENSGAGIADDLREKIFEVAYSSKTTKNNMGLGLAIVQKIMLDHKGVAECEKSESGAKFSLRFPIVNSGMGSGGN